MELIRTGQGHEIDAIIGSMAIGLCSAGGFCAGSIEIVHHQVGRVWD